MFYGDIHNHCDRNYAHGSLDNALQNARRPLIKPDICPTRGVGGSSRVVRFYP